MHPAKELAVPRLSIPSHRNISFDSHKNYLERNMSAPQVDSDIKSRFNYLVFVDLIVFVCILVIAGRPEALAITVSAIIICAVAVLYRSTLGVKAYLANASAKKAKAARRNADHAFGARNARMPAAAPAVPARPSGKSWLRDSD